MRAFKSLLLALVLFSSTLVLSEPTVPLASTSFAFGVAGDLGFNNNSNATISTAGAAGLDFFLVVGDTTYGQASEAAWCSAFRAQVPHVLIEAGNHDTGESPGAELGAILSACPYDLTEPMTGLYGREWFVDYPGAAPLARLILTGCGNIFDIGNGSTWTCAAGDAHYQFVSDAIDGARTAGIPWVIVGMHKNCITGGSKLCEIGADFFNLLLDKRVDLILQGHDHLYERSKQLTCATPGLYRPACVADDGADGRYPKGNGSVVVIQGTGGRSFYSYNPADSEAAYFAAAFDSTYGLVKYAVSETAINVEFVRSAAGNGSDSFVIESLAPPPPPPDTTPPNILLTTPPNGAVTNLSTVWLAGATEPGARVSVDGVEATVGANGSFGLRVALRPGLNLLVATAWDASDNSANATLNVTFLDPIPILEAQIAAAQSDLAAAQARADILEAAGNATQAQLVAARASLTAAQASVAELESDANTTQAELEAAQANLTAAQASLASLEADAAATRAELAAARANVTLAQARLSALEADLIAARAQDNATRAELEAAKAQSAAAADQAGLAMMVAAMAAALAAVSSVVALRIRNRAKPMEAAESPPTRSKQPPSK